MSIKAYRDFPRRHVRAIETRDEHSIENVSDDGAAKGEDRKLVSNPDNRTFPPANVQRESDTDAIL